MEHRFSLVFCIFFLSEAPLKSEEGHSMITAPPLGFDPFFGSKLLPLRTEFIPIINEWEKILQELWTNFENSRNPIFSKTV